MKKFLIILCAFLLISCNQEEAVEVVEEVIVLDTEEYHKTKLKTYNNTLPHIIKSYEEMDDDTYGSFVIEMYDTNYEPVWKFMWRDLNLNDGDFAEDPIIEGSHLIANIQGVISILDLATGEFKWEVETEVSSICAVQDDMMYILGYGDNYITGFNLETGETLLEIEDNNYVEADALCIESNQLIAFKRSDSSSRNAVAFDLDGTYKTKRRYIQPTPKAIVWDEVETSDESENGVNIIDGKSNTFWSESVKGYGEKEWVEITKIIPVTVSELIIVNGNQSSEKAFMENAKLKTITLSVGDGKSFTYKFDKFEYGYKDHIKFVKPVTADYMLLNIIEAEPGEMFKNTCMSEIITE